MCGYGRITDVTAGRAPWNLNELREQIRRHRNQTEFLLDVADSLGRSVFTGWSVVEGYRPKDIVQSMIDRI
jgi:hypothetical protein